ncbi:MAG: Abi family protein [Clostridia bacterium]|nr:Abi family protein [Clostridia bacterium]
MSYGVKLSIQGQIEHMKSQGIAFSVFPEERAIQYLEENNNYFKLRAYRKNYEKNGEGKYIGLDFAYLRDMAIIDMRLRYELLEMCLDIEHKARVELIKAVVDTPDEDGYSVVSDYKQQNEDQYNRIIDRASKSIYCADLQNKYKDKMPIWAMVEMMQFSDLCGFYRFVADRLGSKEMLNHYYMFQEIRQLRNACAHSNCVLMDLKSCHPANHSPDKGMTKELSKITEISGDIRKRKLSNDRIRQITTLLYLYRFYIDSSGLKKYHSKQLHEVFFRRFDEHSDYYKNCEPILTSFNFFKKVVDKWFPFVV